MFVYVIDKTERPLMPTSRCGHVRILLKQKKAKVVNRNPFTIQLLYDTPGITQNLILGIDPGRTNIGLCIVTDDNKPVFSAEVITRNKDVSKLMSARKYYRQKHRQNKRRKKRQRRAKANNTVLKSSSIQRHLPSYSDDKFIECKLIRNKEARFSNRKHPDGWLTPTANQLLQTHVNVVKKLMRFIPINHISIELNKFAFIRLDDPSVHGKQFQNGPLKGYDNDVKAAVYGMQKGKCLLCGEEIEAYHHVVQRHKNGSETVRNRVGLCDHCHKAVHTDEAVRQNLQTKTSGLFKQYGALGVLNQIIPALIEQLNELLLVNITSGWKTKLFREEYGLKKRHHIDAYCIACSENESNNISTPEMCYIIKQFRRHNRQCCKREMINRKYWLDEKIVATNRHKAYEQKPDSLKEYVNHGYRTDQLTVKPHPPIMNDMTRLFPGTLLAYGKEPKVVTKRAEGRYYFTDNTYVPIKKAIKLLNNTGLVFVSNP